jgi:RNA-directed DNA polymerase
LIGGTWHGPERRGGRELPHDPALDQYWADRRSKKIPPLDKRRLGLLHAQDGRCTVCDDLLLHADHEPQSPHEWQLWLSATKKAIDRQSIRALRGLLEPDALMRRTSGSEGAPARAAVCRA